MTKKNTKSKVWKYFRFTHNEDGSPSDSDAPKCRLCLKDVLAKWVNTSNLLNHLKLHHIDKYREISCAAQPSTRLSKDKLITGGQQTLKHCVEKITKFSNNSKEHRRFIEAVTNCIVKDVMPVYAVT